MVYEVATILIQSGMEEQFEHGFSEAVPLFKRAKGSVSMRLERSIETPQRYRVIIGWERIEDHMEGFRLSADYRHWRELVGSFFDGPPHVEHTMTVAEGF